MNGSRWTLGIAALVLCAAELACGSEATTDSPAGVQHDASPDSTADAADGESPTECAMRGGTCEAGFPGSNPPGYTVACPSGRTLANGQQSVTNGGMDIINSALALGCSRSSDGTTTPALCCVPASDAGADDAAIEND